MLGLPEDQVQGLQGHPPANSDGPTLELDTLLGALERLADHHGLAYSRAVALAGVPLENGTLTISSFELACQNLGLKAQALKRKPSSVPGIVCPYVVFFKSGDAGIVSDRKAGSKRLTVEVVGQGAAKRLGAKQLDRDTLDIVIYASPALVEQAGPGAISDHPGNRKAKTGHWLWSAVGQFWGAWLQVAVAALFINLLGLALPLFVMNVYDRVIPYNAIPTLWALAGGVALALVFDFLLRMTRSVIIDRSGRRIDMKVSSDIFRQALGARMDQRPQRAGDIASQIREFESVRDFFTSASLTSLIDLVFVGLFLLVLWWLVGPLVLVPMFAVPVVLIVTLLIQIPLGRSVARGLTSANNRHSVLVESLVGIETVKALSAEGSFQRKWDRAVAESVRATSSSRFWSSLAIFISMTVQQAVSVIIIVWGVYLVSAGEISVGALIASNILAGRVLAPLGGIAMTISRLQQSLMSYRGLNRLMALDCDDKPLAKVAGKIEGAGLELRKASFAYPENTNAVLSELSLTVAPGERVGVIGRVGSGKSTLGKVLCGLYQTTEGAALVDNVDISHRHVADLRQAVCFVGQEPDLFSGTVRENIVLDRSVPDSTFAQATAVSGVASQVQAHPMGYQAPVGERGALISGGQRQAIALARAFVSQPKILFLDEPTSAMDAATEAAFIRNMRQSPFAGTTLIIATHRTSLLDLVDRVVVLDNGRIVADGNKSDVLNKIDPSRGRSRVNAEVTTKAAPKSTGKTSRSRNQGKK